MSNSNIDIAVKWTQVGEQIAKDSATAIQNIGKQAEQSKTHLGALSEISSELGFNFGKLAGFGAVGVLAGLAVHAVDAADQLEALHARTGIAIDDLQRLKYVGAQSGLGLDQLANGVNQLQRRLIDNSPEVNRALADLGLNVRQLVELDGHEMLLAMSDALQKIEDPAKRVALAWELLGKNGAEFLPLLLKNIRQVEEGARIMTDRQVADAARWKAAWDGMVTNLQVEAGEVVGDFSSIGGAFTRMVDLFSGSSASAVVHFWEDLGAGVEKTVGSAEAAAAKNLKWGQSVVPVTRSLTDLLKISRDLEDQQKEQAKAAEKVAEENRKHAEAIYELNSSLNDLSEDEQYYYLSLLQSGKGEHEIQAAYKLTGQQIHELVDWKKRLASVDEERAKGEAEFTKRDILGVASRIDAVADEVAQKEEMWGYFYDDMWSMYEGHVKRVKTKQDEADHAAEEAHQRFVDAIVTEGDRLLMGLTHGWDSFKSAALGVLDDIVAYFEHKFVAAMVASLLSGTNQMGTMFGGLKTAFSGGGVAGEVNSTANSALGGGAGIGIGLATGIATAGIGLIGFGIASAIKDDKIAAQKKALIVSLGGIPDTQFGLGEAGYDGWDVFGNLDRQIAYILAHPNAPQKGPYSHSQRDWINDHSTSALGAAAYESLLHPVTAPTARVGGDSVEDQGIDPSYVPRDTGGWLPGFARGTGGEFVDFGKGTLAMLHGRERVMTEQEAGGGVSLSFGDVHIHANSEAEGYAAARGFRDKIQALFSRGEIQVPARAVRPLMVGG